MHMKKTNRRLPAANKNSHIVTRVDRTGRVRTETSRRDSGIDVAVSTNERSNSTRVFIDVGGRHRGAFRFGADLELTGAEAMTLYRTLRRHFQNTGNPAQDF